MIVLPDPEFYSDWQEWAKAVISALARSEGTAAQPPQVPTFLASEAPSGAVRGFLIELSNATGPTGLCISTSTGWKNVGDGSNAA